MTFKNAVRRVKAEHIKKALAEIDGMGNPKERRSRKWCLEIGIRHYPPKFVLSLAVKYAVGRALSPSEHSGGENTHRYLRKILQHDRRYSIVRCPNGSNTLEY
jgi:hypothetical protein